MQQLSKNVLLMIPAFIIIFLFSCSSFAGGKKGKKHNGDISYSHGHHYDCNLPPGLAKQGKVPPGWAKKCGHQEVKHGRKHNRDHYPDHDHKRTSGGHDKPSIEGSVDIGAGIHIPFP